MSTLEAHIAAVYGRRWRLIALWYVEGCAAAAALWALAHGQTAVAILPALAFLLTCGAALTLPGHALRLVLLVAAVRDAGRRLAMELMLVVTAAATAAALSAQQGWAAIVCILLVGNSLWALELELRTNSLAPRHLAKHAGKRRGFFLRRW